MADNVRDQSQVDYGNGIVGKKGDDGKWYYPWRAEGYQDVLNDNDVQQQQDITKFRNQNPGNTAADDTTTLAEMSGQAPMKNGAMASWTGNAAPQVPQAGLPQTPTNDMQNQLLQQMMQQQQSQTSENAARNTNLYNILMQRAQQGTAIDGNDPNIRQQVDAYSANAGRASRDYMADLAEKAGPYANLRGEQRVQSEHLGQNTGSFAASLIGNELQQRRAEIQNALSQMGSMLSVDQQNALQKQLGILDNAIAQQGLSNNLLSTLLSNQLGNAQLNSNNDQFAAQLGFNAADGGSYWDAVRSGLLG